MKWGFLNPLLLAIVAVIVLLNVLDVDYATYNESAKYLSYLLTPATVCLAVPLYQQMELLNKISGQFSGELRQAYCQASEVFSGWHICLG